ncbi:hypothetical protein D3C74_384870 [compost metagenome]
MLQQFQAVGILEFRIGIREVLADIPKCQRTQNGITYRVQQHVCVRVTQQSFFIRNRYSANNTRASLYQLMYIKSLSYTYHRFFSPPSKNAAYCKSSGVVNLIFV